MPDSVTAALVVIGDEILSGRTKDVNIGTVADFCTELGIALSEVRVVSDVEGDIVAAINAVRARYTYVFTTGGIGPTHDDITADAVAKAFGVALPINPEARALLEARWTASGAEINEARLRMARIPEGGTLIVNSVSAAPGFRIGNVHVMAGVPKIMQAMLEAIAPTLEGGVKVKSTTIRCRVGEGSIGSAFGRIQAEFPDVKMGSYPRMGSTSVMTELVLRSQDADRLALAAERVKTMVADAHKHAGFAEEVEATDYRIRQPRAGQQGDPILNQSAQKSFPVTWDQFHRDSRALAWRLQALGPFDALVAITRGGLVPAAIVARELNIRVVESVAVKSYDHQSQAGIKVLKSITQDILDKAKAGGKILIVDDLVDTGATARVVRDMLPGAHFATVYAKPKGREMVDTFITEVSQDTWIFFPWDLDVAYVPPISGGTD